MVCETESFAVFDSGANFGAVSDAEDVRNAYEVLKDGAAIDAPVGPCDYSPCMFSLVDKFGVFWCLFV